MGERIKHPMLDVANIRRDPNRLCVEIVLEIQKSQQNSGFAKSKIIIILITLLDYKLNFKKKKNK
jgi:hypothetical protein